MVNKQRVSNVYFQRQCKFQIGIFPVIFICIIRKYFSITLKERRVYYRRQNLFPLFSFASYFLIKSRELFLITFW